VLLQQNEDRGNVHEGQERRGQLIISGGNTSEILELQEKAFNKMPLLEKPPITAPRGTGIAFGRDSVIGIPNLKVVQNLVGSVGFVGKDCAARDIDMG